MKNYLIPSSVNSSLFTNIFNGLFINLLVTSNISYGNVADTTTFYVLGGKYLYIS